MQGFQLLLGVVMMDHGESKSGASQVWDYFLCDLGQVTPFLWNFFRLANYKISSGTQGLPWPFQCDIL